MVFLFILVYENTNVSGQFSAVGNNSVGKQNNPETDLLHYGIRYISQV